MKLRLFALLAALPVAIPEVLVAAATETGEPTRTNMREAVKARMRAAAKQLPPPKSNPARPGGSGSPETSLPPAKAPEAKPVDSPVLRSPVLLSEGKKGDETPAAPPTVLPQVEVRRSRITELDRQLHQKEKEIEREKANTRATETDLALNDMRVAKPLAIFGGESAQFRQHVASERVELLEAEKDLLEAIAHAKTREEKQELQKQLEDLKAFRRELDRSLR